MTNQQGVTAPPPEASVRSDGGGAPGAEGLGSPSHAGGGLWLMAGAAFFFSLMSVLVKSAGERLPSPMMVLARGVVTLVLSYGVVTASRRRDADPDAPRWGRRKGLLVLRGLFGFGGLASFYFALTVLPMAEATVIQYTNPILTALLAALILREHTEGRLWLSMAACTVGVLLVTRPPFLFGGSSGQLPALGVAFAFFGAACSAAAYITIRTLRDENPNLIVLYFPLVAVPATLPMVIPVWTWPTPTEWLLLLGIGVTTQIAQLLMTRGLQREKAGRATAVGYLQVALAALWGLVIFGERPDAWTLSGAGIILVGVLTLKPPRVKRGATA